MTERKPPSLAEARKKKPDPKELLETFEFIRKQIESGECVGFSAVLDHQDGTYTTLASGSENSRQSAGGLLELACRRLGFEQR